MFVKTATTAALAAVLGITISTSATAQTMCNKRDTFLDSLKEGYSEAPVAMGLVSNGSVLEVLASKKGSWTIIVTMPNGTSCVVASGDAWEDIERVALADEPAA
jgi:hypothetical protein